MPNSRLAPKRNLILCACLCLFLQAAHPQAPASKLLRKDPVMTRHAEGTFAAKTTPLPPDDSTGGAAIGRYALSKQYQGDLDATSKGEMLGSGDPSKGSAGYVAIEHVTGTLNGPAGSFALQPLGVMDQGKLQLIVSVVPGSGTDALAGISGAMTIVHAPGKLSYTFDYTLPEAQQ